MIDKAKLLESIERYADSKTAASFAVEIGGLYLDECQEEFSAATKALGAALAAVSEPLLDSTVEKAARVLADRVGVTLGTTGAVVWCVQSKEYLATARAMLEAIQ